MTKVHCILVTPIIIKNKKKFFFHIFTAHNAKLKYYIVQLKRNYKKPLLHLLLLGKDKWIHALPLSLTLSYYFTLNQILNLFLIRLYEASQSKREAIGLLLLEDRGRQHVRSSLVEVPLYWRLVWHGDSLSSIPPMFFFIKKLCPHFIYYL